MFCSELVILICLGVSSWFALKTLWGTERDFWGDVLSHEKALSYCPPSLLNKQPVMLVLIHSGQSWNSFWSSYFSIFLLESIELVVVYKYKAVCHRKGKQLKKKRRKKTPLSYALGCFSPLSVQTSVCFVLQRLVQHLIHFKREAALWTHGKWLFYTATCRYDPLTSSAH